MLKRTVGEKDEKGPSEKKKKQQVIGESCVKSSQGQDNEDAMEELMLKIMAKISKSKNPAKKAVLEAKLSKVLEAFRIQAVAKATSTANVKKAKAQQVLQFKPRNTSGLGAGPLSVGGVIPITVQEKERRQQRQLRFKSTTSEGGDNDEDELVRNSGQGTCEALEKEYLRLTSLPRANTVRPPHILRLALSLVKAKWQQHSDYTYACEQLKSIRQDLTVQHVRDPLTVDAYETHARIALEESDVAEFRQCQGVLKQLYLEGIPGNQEEFEAYGLLFAQSTGKGRILAYELPVESLQHQFVAHALSVCRACRLGDFHSFAKLYQTAPRMSPYLMDRLLPRMRAWALKAMVTAYRPTSVPLSHVSVELCLEQDGADLFSVLQNAGLSVDLKLGVLETR
ncbi:hypothetical protein CEUSTIGMA_g5817.t1 [Chlamydomonas eustigma]|uniref:SAC3/GANP/THP3 conserved domain-containing protein n=1 Tax=Chlamydomonas eustigma TaxID=1157962 RepID=A0A250X5M0_9CHLO|nr:hypothetical protein CEUSTIGMA_g5817.t1 [Chlamydomonas eustigma]|eukprot:GAX78375.1 hypothetical protein CEUSTIGMA_g5817.t1 [Chlamydomonas eustigma]